MADPRQIVENLCSVLAAPEAPADSALAELAAAYAELCAQTNTRLRRCLDYLRQGLYSEAVQLAETPPNLLETAALLAFEQRKQWDELCARCRLPAPPPLRLQSALELNESYVKEAELRPLLAQQRRLALARAPLRQRLGVMREVARKDPLSACWKEDIRALESARLAEIRAQVARLSAGHDGAQDPGEPGRAAVAMLDELHDPAWRSPVPADLRQHLETQVLAYRKTLALSELAVLIAPLEQAQANNDLDAALALRWRWLTALGPVQLGMENDLNRRGQRVLDWISLQSQQRQQQHEFEEACAALRLALGTRTDVGGLSPAAAEKLQRLHRAAMATGIELPAVLAADYAGAMRAYQRRSRNQRLRNLAIAAALLLAIVGSVVGFIVSQTRRQTEQFWRAQLNTALERAHWDKAQLLWNEMMAQAPRLRSQEEFKKIRIDLDVFLEEDRRRQQEFQSHMQAARRAGVEEPAQAELDGADQKARTDSEKEEVAQFRAAVAAAALQRRTAAQADFERRLAALAGDAGTLEEKLLSDDPAAFARRLGADDSADQSLRALAAAGAVDDTRQQLPRIEEQLAQAHQRLLLTSAQREQLQAVHEAAGSAAPLAKALEEFASRFPQAPQARDFNAALKYAGAWEALEAWNALLAGWGGKLGVDSAAQAGQRAQQLGDLIRRYPASPLVGDQQNYLQYLSQAQSAADAAWKKSVVQLMLSPLIADIDALPTVRGVYYLRSNAKVTHTSLGATFPAILSNDVSQTTNLTLKEAEVTGKPALSPQSQLAKAILEELDKPATGDWEIAPLAVAQRVRDQKDMDPILQAELLEQILRAAQSGGWGLDSVLKEPLARLGELHAEDIVWVNPTDAGAQAARPAATATLAALPALADIEAQALAQRQRIFDALHWNLAGQGGLFRNSSGWFIQTHALLQNAQEAIIVMGVDPAHPEMLKIGRVKDGKWELDEQKLSVAVEGSLVFIYGGR